MLLEAVTVAIFVLKKSNIPLELNKFLTSNKHFQVLTIRSKTWEILVYNYHFKFSAAQMYPQLSLIRSNVSCRINLIAERDCNLAVRFIRTTYILVVETFCQ